MIIFFADRMMRPLGHASTDLPNGYVIKEDAKVEEVETGVATFSCVIGFNDKNRLTLEKMTNAGNYLLRSNGDENEFYTIIDTEIDSKGHTIQVYAEDAGLDLINEIVGEFEATEEQTAEWYVNTFAADSGFEIGINEIPSSSKRKLSWDGESTVTARLASVAKQFDDYEVSYSFAIKGLEITNKYINLHAKRGKDAGVQLRINRELDNIITSKSVANLATAFVCEGGVPDNEEEPITFSKKNYAYDDGEDFYVDGDKLKSRKANAKWSRYVWNKEPNKLTDGEGYIVRPYSYNTDDPDTLRKHAMTELKKVCDMEVNYEVDIARLPEGTKIGDRVYVVDDAGELYVSTRILLLETSVIDQTKKATLGEHLIKNSGISEKVAEIAKQFAQNSQTAARALSVANTAKTNAEEAKTQAEAAATEATNAQSVANEAKASAETATQSSSVAQNQAQAAQEAVSKVESSVASLETTVTEAKTAADNAQQASQIATEKANEATAAATNAQTYATEAKSAAETAEANAASAITKSETAIGVADEAKTTAQTASSTAAAAKLDAEQAKSDVETFGENLETYKVTWEANYARKTELTETTSSLQAQITANAGQLSSTLKQVTVIDETANNAKSLAEQAQSGATAAQIAADTAQQAADNAKTAADNAQSAADAAQLEADIAKSAAVTAQSVADKAEADLEAAKADLATVQGRVDATEEEIIAAQQAVNDAQSTANTAKADAATAAQKAAEAQSTANTAVTNAENAQAAANSAANQAALAQKTADEAKGNASTAQEKANEAATAAATAQTKASEAATAAAAAQAKADQAADEAVTAQQAAETAEAKAAQAQTDLNTAKQKLEAVTSRVGATEEEIAAAQAAVITAQEAAAAAQTEAKAAQSTADTAKANADTAQQAADNAKTAADNAQSAADEAKKAADKAQGDVNALSVTVTEQGATISQKADKVELEAYKKEVTTTLGGYYTKEETESKLQVSTDSITSSVSKRFEEVGTDIENTEYLANDALDRAGKLADRVDTADSLIQQLADSIKMLVTDNNGASLMTQTATGWTFSTGALQEAVDKTSENLGALQDEMGDVNSTIDAIDTAVKDLGKLSEHITVGSYTYTDEEGNEQTEPSLDFFESDTGFKLKITNTRILFTNDSTVLVEINSKNQSLDIEKAVIKGELQVGDQPSGVWIWKQRNNGNLGLTWKAVSE